MTSDPTGGCRAQRARRSRSSGPRTVLCAVLCRPRDPRPRAPHAALKSEKKKAPKLGETKKAPSKRLTKVAEEDPAAAAAAAAAERKELNEEDVALLHLLDTYIGHIGSTINIEGLYCKKITVRSRGQRGKGRGGARCAHGLILSAGNRTQGAQGGSQSDPLSPSHLCRRACFQEAPVLYRQGYSLVTVSKDSMVAADVRCLAAVRVARCRRDLPPSLRAADRAGGR